MRLGLAPVSYITMLQYKQHMHIQNENHIRHFLKGEVILLVIPYLIVQSYT